MDDYTRKFDFSGEQDAEIHRIMLTVYRALEEKGYNPINQIVGYILSEDPTYITNHNQARTLIRKVDRDELLQILVRNYLLKNAPRGHLKKRPAHDRESTLWCAGFFLYIKYSVSARGRFPVYRRAGLFRYRCRVLLNKA